MTIVVTLVPPEDTARAWRFAAPLLAPAVEQSNGRFDMRTLFHFLREARGQLWLVFDADSEVCAAFTTHVARYPLKAILAVDFIGGTGVEDWLTSVTEMLDRYVIAHQLAGVETCARIGWKHLLKKRGWNQTMAWYEKDAPASGAMQETSDG